MAEQTTLELTPDQLKRKAEIEKAKREIKLLSPKKLVMSEGDSVVGIFIQKHEVKGVDNANKPRKFTTFIFEDYVIGDHFYLTGSALERVEWAKGAIYEIVYNGMSDTNKGQRFKSFSVVEVTPLID